MEEIFKQYGGPIIIAIVVVALIAIFTFLLAGPENPVQEAFRTMLDNFMDKAELEPTPAS